MNVYGHLFQDQQEKLTNDLDALVERSRIPGKLIPTSELTPPARLRD
jgi:hypothetical protein